MLLSESCAASETASPPTPKPVSKPFMLYPSSDITITIAMQTVSAFKRFETNLTAIPFTFGSPLFVPR